MTTAIIVLAQCNRTHLAARNCGYRNISAAWVGFETASHFFLLFKTSRASEYDELTMLFWTYGHFHNFY